MKSKNYFEKVLWSRENILKNLDIKQILTIIPFFRTAFLELFNNSMYGVKREEKIIEYEQAYEQIIKLSNTNLDELSRIKNVALKMADPKTCIEFLKIEKETIDRTIEETRRSIINNFIDISQETNLSEICPVDIKLRLDSNSTEGSYINRLLIVKSKNEFSYNDRENLFKTSNRVILGILPTKEKFISDYNSFFSVINERNQIEQGMDSGEGTREQGVYLSEELILRHASQLSLNITKGGLLISFEPSDKDNYSKQLINPWSQKIVGEAEVDNGLKGVYFLEGEIIDYSSK